MMSSLKIPCISDGELRVKSDYVCNVEIDHNVEGSTKPESGKKEKKRGRNKDRPPPLKFNRGGRLCPVYIDVSPERESWPECTFPGKCNFQHDVTKYLDSKGPDLGEECFAFKNYGRCPRGVTCRFSSGHIKKIEGTQQVRNVVNRQLVEAFGSLKIREKNHLDKNLQTELRKKSYNFSRADKEVDHFFKMREVEQSAEAPPEKIQKLDEPSECQPEDCENIDDHVKLDESKSNGDYLESDESRRGSNVWNNFIEKRDNFKRIDWKEKLYLAPLTTVGNLPFRRICKEFGADITCGEMAMSVQLLQGHAPEWALVQRHTSEDVFGIQLCGSSPQQLTRIAQLVEDGHIDCDFIDLNLGCPIDLVYKRGMGSGLMDRKKPLEIMVRSMSSVMTRPLTLKMRSGIHLDKKIAHNLIPSLRKWGISMITLHGRSREQRYTKLADWEYIAECAQIAKPLPLYGNGDIFNYEDYYQLKEGSKVDGVMIARGALIKPWVFTEIKEKRHWDISASERLEMIRRYANYGMEHWGSDDRGVETTRRFLLEWLSFLHRYVPHGILESPPQRMNERIPVFRGRSDLETLLSSTACSDWIKITEMFLGKVPDNFVFVPKHRANGY